MTMLKKYEEFSDYLQDGFVQMKVSTGDPCTSSLDPAKYSVDRITEVLGRLHCSDHVDLIIIMYWM